MNDVCVRNCEFLKTEDVPKCIFYGLYLKINSNMILRCSECINDERNWAIEKTIKEVANEFVSI